MDQETSAANFVLITILIAGTLMSGNAILLALDDNITGITGEQHDITHLDQDEFVTVGDQFGAGTNETVYDSRGLAMRFYGSDQSYVASSTTINFASDDTWTISQPVLEMHNQSVNQTLLAIGDPTLMLQYINGTQDKWSAVYMTATDSYRVSVSATSPSNKSFIYVTRNQTNLTIWRGSTKGGSVDVSSDNALAGNLTTSQNCNCTVDETRSFDDVLSSSERDQLKTNPVAALPDTNRTARVMYDEGSWAGDTVYIFFASSDAEHGSDIAYVDGFDGHVMERDNGALDLEADYYWEKSGPQIKPTNGGRLDEAPVAYVEYTLETSISRIRKGWVSAVGLSDIVMLILILVPAIAALRKVQNQP